MGNDAMIMIKPWFDQCSILKLNAVIHTPTETWRNAL